MMRQQKANAHTKQEKIAGALMYGISSLTLMLVNKYVFATWLFPSANFLALSQFTATPLILYPLRSMGYINFPFANRRVILEVFPLPLLYLGNTVCGLMATKLLSIPMFGVLRRLTLLFTLILEKIILSYEIKQEVVLALSFMLFGSLVAATNDLSFNLYAYMVILANNLLTALTGVISKVKLNKPTKHAASAQRHNDEEAEGLLSPEGSERTNSKESENDISTPAAAGLGTWGLLFYNSIFAAPFLLVLMMIVQPHELAHVRKYGEWSNPAFLLLYSLSTILGTVIQYSIMYCTKVNSALATNVTGSLKNVLTTYIGMIAPGLDYNYSFYNFIGVNLSMLGGIYYARLQLKAKSKKEDKSNSPNDPFSDIEMKDQMRRSNSVNTRSSAGH